MAKKSPSAIKEATKKRVAKYAGGKHKAPTGESIGDKVVQGSLRALSNTRNKSYGKSIVKAQDMMTTTHGAPLKGTKSAKKYQKIDKLGKRLKDKRV